MLEWYDFALFGLMASLLSEKFFPHESPTASLLQTFSAFAIGYFMRPLGGLLFGWVGDQLGRKRALELSVWLMVIPTVLMGLLPTYEDIGLAAPIILVALRIVQGLSIGGEWVGSMVFLVESAEPKNRGANASWGLLTVSIGLLLGSAVALIVSRVVGEARYDAWAWRLPYISGLVLGVFAVWTRAGMEESPAFEELVEAEEVAHHPVRTSFREAWRPILIMMGSVAVSTASFTAFFVWAPTHVISSDHLSQHDAMLSNTIGLLVLAALTPLGGRLSDRVGYVRLYRLMIAVLAVGVVPLMISIGQPSFGRIVVGQVGFGLLLAFLQPSAVFADMFPPKLRASAMGIGYNVPQAILGGLTPLVCTWLFAKAGSMVAPGLLLAGVAILSFSTATRLES
ncbi:MAG: MFS transporter [Myxococcota bacterium]